MNTSILKCKHCGYSGRFSRQHTWLSGLAVVVWIIPLGFLAQGYWPFLIMPAILVTIWAMLSRVWVCPQCGAHFSRL